MDAGTECMSSRFLIVWYHPQTEDSTGTDTAKPHTTIKTGNQLAIRKYQTTRFATETSRQRSVTDLRSAGRARGGGRAAHSATDDAQCGDDGGGGAAGGAGRTSLGVAGVGRETGNAPGPGVGEGGGEGCGEGARDELGVELDGGRTSFAGDDEDGFDGDEMGACPPPVPFRFFPLMAMAGCRRWRPERRVSSNGLTSLLHPASSSSPIPQTGRPASTSTRT